MASEKQIAANRLNAQHSTGPRTPEGKSKSRLNAKRDGITGQVLTLSAEDLPIFEQLKSDLIADLAPKTVMELHLASSIAWDTWRLDHLRAVEMNTYALGTTDPETQTENGAETDPQIHTAMSGALTFGKHAQRFALMSIYEQRLNRSIHRNLTTLRQLQTERRTLYQNDLRQETATATANNMKGLPYQAPARKSQNGFIFSTSEILAAANRDSFLDRVYATVGLGPRTVVFEGAWENYREPSPNRPNSGLTVAAAA